MFENYEKLPKWLAEITPGLEDTIQKVKEDAEAHRSCIQISASPDRGSFTEKVNTKDTLLDGKCAPLFNKILDDPETVKMRNSTGSYHLQVPRNKDILSFIESMTRKEHPERATGNAPDKDTPAWLLAELARAHSCAIRLTVVSLPTKNTSEIELAIYIPGALYLFASVPGYEASKYFLFTRTWKPFEQTIECYYAEEHCGDKIVSLYPTKRIEIRESPPIEESASLWDWDAMPKPDT